MSAITAGFLAGEARHTETEVARLHTRIASLETELADLRDELAGTEEHLHAIQSLRALTSGDFTMLAPGQIASSDGVLGLSVGPMQLAPPDGATIADLRLYAGTLRAIYDQALHQARLVGDTISEREHRAVQANRPTGELRVEEIAADMASPDPAEIQPSQNPRAMACASCGTGVVRDSAGWWVHVITGDQDCLVRRDDGTVRPPVAPALTPCQEDPPRHGECTGDFCDCAHHGAEAQAYAEETERAAQIHSGGLGNPVAGHATHHTRVDGPAGGEAPQGAFPPGGPHA